MLDGPDSPVSLRKVESPPAEQSKKRRRSSSVPRSVASITERAQEQERRKLIRVRQIQEELRLKREKEEDLTFTPHKMTPVLIKKKKPQKQSPWDEFGRLVQRDELPPPPQKKEENAEPVPKFKSCLNTMSVLMLCKHEQPSLAARQTTPRKKNVVKRRRSMSVSRETFEEFVARQEVAALNKVAVTEPKRRRHSSVMSPMSRKIAKTVKTPPKRPPEADECTFMPDLSLTRHVKARGLGCQESVTQKMITQVRLEDMRLTYDQRRMARCTFSADVSKTKSSFARLTKKDREEMIARKTEKMKNEAQKIAEERDKQVEEDAKYIAFVHEIPEKQLIIHELLGSFRIEKRKNRDPIDTHNGKRKRRSASVPHVSKS